MTGHLRHRHVSVMHHDPTPHAVVTRSPFPWFAVAIMAGFAAIVLN